MKYLYLLFIALATPAVFARPLYEFGLGGGVAHVPDYPASKEERIKYIFIPTAKYRGKIFRNDDKGTRARIFKVDGFNIDLSFSAAFPANSEENEARQGMNDLDWLFEIGPRLNFDLHKTSSSATEFELPIRTVLSTDFSFTRSRGYHLAPRLVHQKQINQYFQIGASFSLDYVGEELADYFYEVKGSDINEERYRYNAKGGYLGNRISTSIRYRDDKSFTIVGISYSNYKDAVNENSPLYTSEHNISIFMGFNYLFYESKEQGHY